MPRKKPSEKNKTWEKDRRDRLNKSFEQLAILLPQYDPSVNWSKIEIIQKSIEHIEQLHKKHEDFLKTQDVDILKQYNEFIELLKYLQSRNGQLADLLVKAKISLPASKPPVFFKDNLKLCENNNLTNINIKPVGRPGKYVNKIDKTVNDDHEKEETNFDGINIKPNTNKNSVPTEDQQNVSPVKQKENISSVNTAVTVNSDVNLEKPAVMTTGVLVPVIPIQPQPALIKSVISSSQLIPPVIPPIPSMPPLIIVTNLKSTQTQSVAKNTTMTHTHVFNYTKEKNGKIKILPRPQIKLYFRRADGKIPIPVIRKRISPVKRKRKRKSKTTPYIKCGKKRKVEKTEETKEIKLSNEEKESAENKTDQSLKAITADDIVKNKENVPVPSNELQSDYLTELEIPQNETNPNSVSPTAAFLMSFPVVNTSNGKFPGMVDDGEILTPNLERKDSAVDNLENLNNFFTTKEYTKYCRESSEKSDNSKKNGKSITIIEDIKIPPASYNPNTFFNPFTISNTSSITNPNTVDNISRASTTTETIACTFNSVTSQAQFVPTYKQSTIDSPFANPVNPSSQGKVSKTENLFTYSNNCDHFPSYLNHSITSSATAGPKSFSKEENIFSNSTQVSKVSLGNTTTMTSESASKQTNLAFKKSTTIPQLSTPSMLTSSHKDIFFGTSSTTGALSSSAAPTITTTPLASTTSSFSTPVPVSKFRNSLLSTCVTLSVSRPEERHAQNNFSSTGTSSNNTNMYRNQAVSTTSVLENPVVWPNSITSSFINSKNSISLAYTPAFTTTESAGFSKSSAQITSQNILSTSGNTFNSFSTNLVPKCTPLPLQTIQKNVSNNSQNLMNSSVSQHPTHSSLQPKFDTNWNNISTSLNSTQRPDLPPPSCVSIASSTSTTLSSTFSYPPPEPCNFNVSQPNSAPTKERNSQASKISITSSSNATLKPLTSYGMTNPLMSVNSQKIGAGACSNFGSTASTSSLVTSLPEKSQSIVTSTKTTSTNLVPIYTESVTQGPPNTNVTSAHIYPSTANYYYPQAPSTFTLNLTTSSSIPSQIAPSQGVLPYSSLKPEISWIPPITTDYKPSFTFSLTSTSTTSCKESVLNSFMTSSTKHPNLANFSNISNESKNNTKTVFSPYESSFNYKRQATGNHKEPAHSFSSTNFTFSLTNTKSSITTTAESKIPFTPTNPPKIPQQFNNFDNKYQPASQQIFNFNPQIKTPQKDACFTFALTNTPKILTTPQKPRNPFTIDATLGIGNDSTCFMDGQKKPSNPTLCSRSENKIQPPRSKPLTKTAEGNNVSMQPNTFYECNQKTEKFGQKGHVNWMTSSEIHSSSAEYGQSSSYRMATEPYHPYGVCEENFPSWSPSKMYDTPHLMVPPSTVPSYYSDMNFNTPTYNVAPGVLDTPKTEKNYKPPMNNGNQANFFSVSHLVDQGTNSKQYNRCHKKISVNKSKDGHKQEDFKPPPYLNQTPQAMFSENLACSGAPKPQLSNNYSAEALISKKEKHRNFGGMTTSEFYNPMDVSGVLYNHPDGAEQNYNSNYFYNYPTNQNYGQDNDYLGAYTSDNQFGKTLHKYNKKIPPPTPAPPPPNLISYDSNYFPAAPLSANSSINPHPPLDGFESHHYNHSGNFQTSSWGTKTSGHPASGYQNQNQHFHPNAEIEQINSGHVQNSAQPAASGNLTNFNLSTICPEINDKGAAPSVW